MYVKKGIILLVVTPLLYILVSCDSGGFEGRDIEDGGKAGSIMSQLVNGIFFKNSITTEYGFDAKPSEDDAYISIESNYRKTDFFVNVSNIPENAAASTSDAAKVTVTSASDCINNSDTDIEIESGSGVGAAEILVNGCTGEIPGDCYIPKNKLYVKVYDLKKTDLNLTILNSASFTTTGIKNYFNDILKQAAYKIEPETNDTLT